MKSLNYTLAAFLLMFSLQTNAQLSVSINLGSTSHCGGYYENQVRYYYLPEIEAYYDINAAVFIYNSPRGWIRTTYLPEYCQNYNFNRGYKIALTYRGPSPYVNFSYDREKYWRDNYRNYREEYYERRHDNRRHKDLVYNSGRRSYDYGYDNHWQKAKHHNGRECNDRD